MKLNPRSLRFNWTRIPQENLWYLVGLIATDGCLSTDGRHVDITAKDPEYLAKVKKCCNIPQAIAKKVNGRGQFSHRIQIGSVDFYRFLTLIGLTTNKSKTIGPLAVPDRHFFPFFRGVIDGDGSIRSWTHPSNGRRQWSLRIVSGSRLFLEWLDENVSRLLGATGKIHDSGDGKKQILVLKFGKIAATEILTACYRQSKSDLHLDRKYLLAKMCISSKRGWQRSKTVLKARVVELVDTQDSRKWVSPWQHEGNKLGEFGEV